MKRHDPNETMRRYHSAMAQPESKRPKKGQSALCLVCGTIVDPVSWPVHPSCMPDETRGFRR